MSLKQTIKDYCKKHYPRVIHKGEIGRKAVNEWGFENENSGRRCRELENEGWLVKIPHPKGEAQYQYNIGKEYAIPEAPKAPTKPLDIGDRFRLEYEQRMKQETKVKQLF